MLPLVLVVAAGAAVLLAEISLLTASAMLLAAVCMPTAAATVKDVTMSTSNPNWKLA